MTTFDVATLDFNIKLTLKYSNTFWIYLYFLPNFVKLVTIPRKIPAVKVGLTVTRGYESNYMWQTITSYSNGVYSFIFNQRQLSKHIKKQLSNHHQSLIFNQLCCAIWICYNYFKIFQDTVIRRCWNLFTFAWNISSFTKRMKC